MREFNRFYTSTLGLLRRRHLGGEYSLTEARILYEIGATPRITASTLRETLRLDAGYISRILSSLTKRKLVRQTASMRDAREKLLLLTATGQRAVDQLNEQSTTQIRELLTNTSQQDREALVSSLSTVRSILSRSLQQPLRVVRLTAPNDEAHQILDEYYEAVQVIQRDKPGTMQKLIDESDSGIWLAYLRDEVVGCVVLRNMPAIHHAAECKRLYVKPSARGHRIADALLDAQEEYARTQKIQWIYLDTHDGLKTAITLYDRRGYEPCKRYNDNPQATLFMRKRIGP